MRGDSASARGKSVIFSRTDGASQRHDRQWGVERANIIRMTKVVTSWCAIENTYLSFVPPCCCSRRPLSLLPLFLYAARLFVHFKACAIHKAL